MTRGLSREEAAARLGQVGPSDLAPPQPLSALRELIRDLANPLVPALLAAIENFGSRTCSAATRRERSPLARSASTSDPARCAQVGLATGSIVVKRRFHRAVGAARGATPTGGQP